MTPPLAGACTCFGELTINDVLMHTPAWNVVDLAELWMPPKLRGTNITIGGSPGQMPFPQEVDQTDYPLPMFITGDFDKDGNVDPDGKPARLIKNLQYLRDNVFGPSDNTTDTWTATIATPWGDNFTADVQVIAITTVGHRAHLITATLDLRVPAGEFAVV